ncbi:putative major facilitator superfamily transporter (plasmid) [Selenomonas ruminantium subsp. lactilytica TAM6421]|uniref:Putative major facilitator superfamily transporter n=1 Tax=Selenomonas ruminantium subsp. lactilytica (strain NBRC 103574 / TAM6421) TaxID=927704 RepID=I0GVU3_SELRL|nr:MFS transporter [Selenomonas ruminantium]BAL84880.1 putative major facilitator superfamily transporter [Selenomonas ruminantium subsp. lactilytica TAM6421]
MGLKGREFMEKEKGINKQLLLLIMATGVFSILNTEMGFIGILPYIAENYQVTVVQAGWLISLFALGVAVAGPTMPLIMSRFNRKWVMVFILGLFTVCSTIAVFAENFYVLLAVRVLPAFFHPVYCAMAFTVAAGLAKTGEEPKMIAKINMGVAAGMVAGVPISNFLAEQFSLAFSMAFFALATWLVMLATLYFMPSMPVKEQLGYGEQLAVLKKPMVWASIAAVIFLNGSIFGVFNYLAEYLGVVSGIAPSLISILLLVYGLCNVGGSMLAGNLLTVRPLMVVKIFPLAVAVIYIALLGGGSIWPVMGLIVVLWGLLGGINANINQYWIASAAPEAPDFANGLFLTAANMGCVLGTTVSGHFIDAWGTQYVVLGGLLFCLLAALTVWVQCYRQRSNPQLMVQTEQ